MARIRTLKPEFWQDEKLSPLPAIDRLVFLGLVSQADDAGRIVDTPRLLDGLLFPHTNDTCASSLGTLATVGVIARGRTASGQRVIQIVGWAKHQKVDHPNMKGALPPIVPPDSRECRESVANDSRTIPTTYDQRPATSDSDQRPLGTPSAALAPKKRKPTKWTVVPDDWQPSEQHKKLATELGVSLNVEAAKFRDHEFARPKTDPDRCFNRWLRQAKEFAGNRAPVGSEAAGWTNDREQNHYRGHSEDASLRAGAAQLDEGERVKAWMRDHRDEAREMYDAIIAALPEATKALPEDEVEHLVLDSLRKRIVNEKLRGVA
jgi:hypothetical protein